MKDGARNRDTDILVTEGQNVQDRERGFIE